MAKCKFDFVLQYKVEAVCREPLHIGDATGEFGEVLIHPIERVPFVQATSLAGVFRSKWDASCVEEMLGSSDNHGTSRVVFGDGIFERETISLERRPRLKMNREKGVGAGQKFEMTYVPEGATFSFPITIFCFSSDKGRYEAQLERILAAIHKGDVQFGAQKTNGCGFLSINYVGKSEFSMLEPEERKQWFQSQSMSLTEITETVTSNGERSRYQINLYGEVDQSILVKALAPEGTGKENADSVNVRSRRNGKLQYVLPGSSIKGVCQSHAEKILRYFGKNDVKNPLEKVVFMDAMLSETKDRIHRRIHIDKFTGSVMDKGLFSDRPVKGRVKMMFEVPKEHKDKGGLLLTVLRDVAIGEVSFGSGRNVGRGYINVDRIEIISPTGENDTIKVQDGQMQGAGGLVQELYLAWKEAMTNV